MFESGKTTLSSQFVQVPDTPTNFHRPSTSRIIELAKALDPLNPPPKEDESSPVKSITYLKIFAYSTHQVSSRSLHSNRFPRFPVYPSTPPPNVTRSVGIENQSSETSVPSKYRISLKSGYLFLS